MAKDNFWKNPAVIQALLMLSDRYSSDNSDAEDQLTLGELFKSNKTRNMLKPAGIKYPSQLDIDTVRKANNEWWNPFDDNTIPQLIYASYANNWGTVDSFKNRLIGMTKNDPRLNEIVFNEDGSINEANLDRIARVAYAKLGSDSWLDGIKQNPKYYFITPGMSEDKARFYAEGIEDLLGDTEDYKNYNINKSGALLAAKDRIDREYLNRSKQQDMTKLLLEAAKAGSLANNDVEATIGGDPVSVLPSYVQASYEKTPEDELEEELFKRRAEDDEKWEQIRSRARKRFDENKKGKDWWWL